VGWFFRRAVRLGPVRFNFSARGVGASIGVRGLRVGQNARGKNYIFGSPGGGLYYRQTLPGGGRMTWRGTLLVLLLLAAFAAIAWHFVG